MSTIPVVKNDAPTQLGGRKKRGNGHKASCGCPICKNMKNSKRGGEEPETEFKTGGKKKNGHKANCGCPICINMKHAKRTKRNRHNKHRGSKKRGGGEDENELDEKQHGMIEEELDEEKHGFDKEDEYVDIDIEGGRRRKKSNGHKANCKCPICKNMKKNKRGGNDDGDIENQKGDIEEGFVKGEKIVDVETKAGDDDYEEIEEIQKMEEGQGKGPYNPQAYENVGGKRRTRKHKSRRHRKRTRRHRRH
jgi:hypothetical protein